MYISHEYEFDSHGSSMNVCLNGSNDMFPKATSACVNYFFLLKKDRNNSNKSGINSLKSIRIYFLVDSLSCHTWETRFAIFSALSHCSMFIVHPHSAIFWLDTRHPLEARQIQSWYLTSTEQIVTISSRNSLRENKQLHPDLTCLARNEKSFLFCLRSAFFAWLHDRDLSQVH